MRRTPEQESFLAHMTERLRRARAVGQVELHVSLDEVEALLLLTRHERVSVPTVPQREAEGIATQAMGEINAEQALLLLGEFPFTEASHGNRKTAARLRPLVELGLVERHDGSTTRTWARTPAGEIAANMLRVQRSQECDEA